MVAPPQKSYPHPNSQNLWILPYLGKKNVFADVVKLRILR